MNHNVNTDKINKIMGDNDYEKLLQYKNFNFGLLNRNSFEYFLKDPNNLNIIKHVIDNVLNIQDSDRSGYYPMQVFCTESHKVCN